MSVQGRNDPSVASAPSTGVLGAIVEPTSSADLLQILTSAPAGVLLPQLLAQPLLDRLRESVASIVTGVVLLKDTAGNYQIAASGPVEMADQANLQKMSERAITAQSTVVFRSLRIGNAQARAGLIVASPIMTGVECSGAVVLLLAESSATTEMQARRCIELSLGWLHAAYAKTAMVSAHAQMERAKRALQALALVDEHDELHAAAMQLTAHLEVCFSCERASVGLADRHGRIKIVAFSHSVMFDLKSDAVRRLQGAMEECFDQDATIAVPPNEAGPRLLSLAHMAMAEGHACLSVVLRTQAANLGVITLERAGDRKFEAEDIAACELIASLVAPALEAKRQRHHWLSGRAVRSVSDACIALFGPRRPALKLISILGVCVVIFLCFATGEYRISAKSVVEGLVQRAATAPFDGFVATANVRAGQIVHKGDVLATLDDHDLQLERARWFGEREQRLKQYSDAFVKHDRATAGVLAAQVAQAESQLALAEDNLARARVLAPLDGIVVQGDLSQLIGSPVEKGKVLFEIAPLENFRVILKVDERDVAHVKVGQTGQLAIAGVVGSRVPFRIQNITSVTSADEGRNLFRVEADLLGGGSLVRPGMEGVGKIEAGKRNLLWIWTHSFFDWARLKLWTLLP